MRKAIIIIFTILLAIGVYFGRGFLPYDQVKQSLLVQYLSCYSQMQLHLDYSIEAYEQGDMEEFTRQMAAASGETKNAHYMIGGPETSQYFESTPQTSELYKETLRVVNEVAAKAILEEVNSEDIEKVREFNQKLTLLFDTIGDPIEISKGYHPSSELSDKINSGIKDSF